MEYIESNLSLESRLFFDSICSVRILPLTRVITKNQGFGDRLLCELRKPSPKDTKIRISAPQERLYSTWIGGSILGEFSDQTVEIFNRTYTLKL